jgi:subtilisin-like proprotein convertase family protein
VNNEAIAIPDGAATGVISTIGITDNGTIQDIAVTVDIQHDYLGDISVQVIAPSGEAIMLQGRNLGRNTQLQSTYTLQNTPALQLLLEQPSAGEWQLQVVDSIAGDTGTLNSWRLSIGI